MSAAFDDMEPTAAELAAIEAEWPVIEAGLAVLDAEIRILSAVPVPGPLDRRRLRRAQHQLLTAAIRHAARHPAPVLPLAGEAAS